MSNILEEAPLDVLGKQLPTFLSLSESIRSRRRSRRSNSWSTVEATLPFIDDALPRRRFSVTSTAGVPNSFIVADKGDAGRERHLAIIPGRATAHRTLHLASVEVLSIKVASHPNVLELLDWYEDAANDRSFVLSEYVHTVPLSNMTEHGCFQVVGAGCLEAVMKSAASALARLHAGAATHGDINPATVCIADDGSVRIVDVGLRRLCTAEKPVFEAPERGYSCAADMWALGMTLFVCLVGRMPTSDLSLPDTTPLLRTAIPNLLQRNPSDRMTAAELETMIQRGGQLQARERNAEFQCAISIDAWELSNAIVKLDKLQTPVVGGLWSPFAAPMSTHSLVMRRTSRSVSRSSTTSQPLVQLYSNY